MSESFIVTYSTPRVGPYTTSSETALNNSTFMGAKLTTNLVARLVNMGYIIYTTLGGIIIDFGHPEGTETVNPLSFLLSFLECP